MNPEENTERKLYTPPDFYVLDFNETKGGDDPDVDEALEGHAS